MAGMFQNFMQGMGSLDDRQRAILLALAAGGSPNPRMQAPLSAASQGLMQSIQEEANRKQREQEAAALAQLRERELEIRKEEAAATREDTTAWRENQMSESRRDRAERRADRKAVERDRRDYNSERLRYEEERTAAAREAATALAQERGETTRQLQERERMAQAAEARGDLELAARLRGVSIPSNPMGGLGGFNLPGSTGVQGQPTLDDLIRVGVGRPPNG